MLLFLHTENNKNNYKHKITVNVKACPIIKTSDPKWLIHCKMTHTIKDNENNKLYEWHNLSTKSFYFNSALTRVFYSLMQGCKITQRYRPLIVIRIHLYFILIKSILGIPSIK